MKILHVINSLHFGGAEKLLLDIIPEFKNRGIDIEVMVLYNEKTFFYTELEDKHQIKVLAPAKLKSLYSFSHVFWIRKHLKDYDVVHVHLFPSFYWVGAATLFLYDRPKLVISEHNTENRRRSSLFLRIVDSLMYKRYDAIVAISQGVKDSLITYLGSKNTQIKLINNGVQIASFNTAHAYTKEDLDLNLQEDTRIIIQISSFTAQKDQDTLIKAMSLLPENMHLLLVGYGVLIEEKRELAKELHIEHRVHFLGYRTDIPKLLKIADICVLSSHYEGFGLAIVEGMAAGLPCIGSDVEGLSQVIGDAGMLFEPENHIALKEEIDRLLSSKAYYDAMSQKSVQRSKLFDISLMIESHIHLYRELKQ